MRELKPSIAMHDVNRPIARAKAEFLNNLAYAFDQASPLRDEMQVPSSSKVTVSTVVVPPRPLSITDSAIYRELYEYITTGEWNADLIFPTNVPAYEVSEPLLDQMFDRRVGRELLILYKSFYDLLDAENGFASPIAPRDY